MEIVLAWTSTLMILLIQIVSVAISHVQLVRIHRAFWTVSNVMRLPCSGTTRIVCAFAWMDTSKLDIQNANSVVTSVLHVRPQRIIVYVA